MFVFGFIPSVQAYIKDQADLAIKIESLEALRDYDTLTLINKADLIGNRLDDFNSARAAYNSSLNYSIDQLYQIQNEINKIQNSGLSADEKMMQTQRLYQDANTIITSVNNQASMYMNRISYSMPMLTYDKYRKKFWEFYSSLGL